MTDCTLTSISTPCAVVDIDRVRRNAERMRAVAAKNGVRLRPHVKTHKCVEIASIQTGGGGPITVSTLAEARVLAANGFNDITYAVPIERGKFHAVTELLQNDVKLNLLTDDADTVRDLDAESGKTDVKSAVFLKIDCGTHRVGVEPTSDAALAIPRLISDAANLEFAGILTHAGHSYDVDSREAILKIAHHERDVMTELAARLKADGIDVLTVSIGSTPTMSLIDDLSGIDEIRPGNYIFYDAYQATLGSCGFDDTALTILTAIIHKDVSRNKLVVDAGAIALSKDRGPVGLNANCGYGHVLDLDGNDTNLRVTSLSQEHGEIHADDASAIERFKVGDRVRILANHSCLTAAQHSHLNIFENGQIVDRWEVVKGW